MGIEKELLMKPVEISKIVRTCVRFEFLGNNVFLNFVDEPVMVEQPTTKY